MGERVCEEDGDGRWESVGFTQIQCNESRLLCHFQNNPYLFLSFVFSNFTFIKGHT